MASVRVLLLCEDIGHERLFRPVLERKFDGRVRVEIAGGFAGVKASFPAQLARMARRPQENLALIVVFDGDGQPPEKRLRDLRAAAAEAELTWDLRLCCCEPKRNVETWVWCLAGEGAADEIGDFKDLVRNSSKGWKGLSKLAASAWVESAEEVQRSAERLPSFAAAVKDLDRLARHLNR
jgi:hypothetical protein